MSITRFIAFAFAGALLVPAAAFAQEGLAQPAGPDAQVFFSTSCKVKRILATSENTVFSLTSAAYVNLPGGSISFTTPGTVPSCVQVDFSGMTFGTAPNNLLFVRALLDGVPMQPGDVQFSGDDDEDNGGDWARSHNHQWIANVNPGAHTITIQVRSFFGGIVNIFARTLTLTTK
jgi:hypothetical protein